MPMMKSRSRFAKIATKKEDKEPQVLVVQAPELETKIREKLDLQAKIEFMQADVDAISADIKAAAEPLRCAASQNCGTVLKSINLNGKMIFTSQHRYPKLDAGKGDILTKTFGERFADYFVEEEAAPTVDIAVLDKCSEDAEVNAAFDLLAERGVLGIAREWKPTDLFTRDITFNADVRAKAESLGIKAVQMLKEAK